MKNFIILCLITNIYAAVPIVNATDHSWKLKYTTQAAQYLTWISDATTNAKQMQGLQGLQQFSKGGDILCKLCTPQDMKDLKLILDGINGGLCEVFTIMMAKLTGIQEQYKSLNQIQQALQDNPAEASLALQQAGLQSQMSTQQTLEQMQSVQTQQIQKNLIEDKIQNQTRNSIWLGIKGTK